MEKQEAMSRWVKSEPNQPVMPHFTPIAADARGSTFGACGIRISGNPAFIDAVLSRLKDVLEAETSTTRLVLSRQPVKPVSIQKGDGKPVDKHWDNAADDAEVCYLQIRERTRRTRSRKAMEATPELPVAEGGGLPDKVRIKPAKRAGDLFDDDDASAGDDKDPEPVKVAHIGSRNGEVLWDDDEGEDEP